jgi:hypothetical protein
MSLYDFEAQSIDHQTVPLSRYQGPSDAHRQHRQRLRLHAPVHWL